MKTLQQLRAAREGGFTLIELIIVIVIIGILAAVAIPKFTDLTGQAKTAAINGVAGNLASAAANNYALKSGGLPGGVAIANCQALAGLVTGGNGTTGVIGKYTITDTALTAGTEATCTISETDDATVTTTFTGIGAS